MADKPELLVTVFSDYICPFCYVGSARLRSLQKDFDMRVNWAFMEIHPDNPTSGRPVEELGYPPEQWRYMMANLKQMAIEEGLLIAERTFTTNSHKALLLAEAAKEVSNKVFYRLHDRLFEAYLGEGQNIGDENVLRMLARQANVPEDTVTHAWQEQHYEKRLQSNLAMAGQLGITGTPAFVFDKRALMGAVPTTVLRDAAAYAIRTA
ncbi:MAG: DsbA family protein [Acidiferrobacterales bacterium]